VEQYLWISLGAIAGANTRYLISVRAAARYGVAFPYGTFAINVSGSALMGFLIGLLSVHFGNSAATRALLATGFLGAYTTFSTFTWETLALFREREIGPAMVNVLGSALLGIGGALAGIWLGQQTGGWW
jgi:CrcB protein